MMNQMEREKLAELRELLGSPRVLELLGGRPAQRTDELLALYTDAARVRPLATAFIVALAAACGVKAGDPPALKACIRILEKARAPARLPDPFAPLFFLVGWPQHCVATALA